MYEDRERLIAESTADRILEKLPEEKLGIVVEEPPRLDSEAFVEVLSEDAQHDIGLAVVGIKESDTTRLQEMSEGTRVRVTDEVSVAVKWRNATDTEFDWGERSYRGQWLTSPGGKWYHHRQKPEVHWTDDYFLQKFGLYEPPVIEYCKT